MLDRIASLVSLILSPFLVLIAAILLIVLQYASTSQDAILWFCISTLFASVLPFLFILMLVRLGKLSGIEIAMRSERIGPLFFILGSALIGTLILHRIGAPKVLVLLGIAYVVSGAVFTAITPFWKISFHSGALAACITALWLSVSPKMLFLGVLLPLVTWARVYRRRHTLLQNIIAMLIAIAITVTVILFG